MAAVRGLRIGLGTVHHGIVICLPGQITWVFDWGSDGGRKLKGNGLRGS